MPVEGHSDASDDDHEWDLEMELLTLPASGGSVRQTQRLASRIARGCGQAPPPALELGKLPNDSHRERAMHRWASKQAWRRLLPTPFEFGLPRASNQIDEAIVPHSALLPHETFASLAVHTDLFNELLRGPPGQLENFWAKSAESLWFQQHPLRDEISHRPQLCIPAGLHGDEGGVFGSPNHALVLTWGSVVQELLTLDSRILFAGLLMRCLARPWKPCARCSFGASTAWRRVSTPRPTTPASPSRKTTCRAGTASGGNVCIRLASGAFGRSSGAIGSGKRSRCTWTSTTTRTTSATCAVRAARSSGCGTPSSGGQPTFGERKFGGAPSAIGTRIGFPSPSSFPSSASTSGGAGAMRCTAWTWECTRASLGRA